MNRLRKASYFKLTALVLTGLFLLQGIALPAQEQNENLDSQWNTAKKEYSDGKIERSLNRLERLSAACENKGTKGKEIERIYGLTLLLRGICHESLGDSKKAKKFYKNSRGWLSYDDFTLAGLDLTRLKLYNKYLKKMSKVIEQEKKHPGKKKKFPWLLVAGGVVVVGAAVYFLLLKNKPQQTLTVSVGQGVEGTPANGTQNYKKGTTVNYSFSLKSGFRGLEVQIDGQAAPAGGTIKMDKDHNLTATASKAYTLAVTKGPGVDGTPDSGTFPYSDGETVNYIYSIQSGYTDLVVTIDGSPAPESGSILMTRDHSLTVTAKKLYTLTVTKGVGVIGLPESGTYSYKEGEPVTYNYGLKSGYNGLVVTIDGISVNASGIITMDRDHTLAARSNAGAAGFSSTYYTD